MTFIGQEPVRSEIVTNNKITEQTKSFNYLGCLLSHENEKNYISKFLKITGLINNIF